MIAHSFWSPKSVVDTTELKRLSLDSRARVSSEFGLNSTGDTPWTPSGFGAGAGNQKTYLEK